MHSVDIFPSISFIPKHLELKASLEKLTKQKEFSMFFNKFDSFTSQKVNFVEKTR